MEVCKFFGGVRGMTRVCVSIGDDASMYWKPCILVVFILLNSATATNCDMFTINNTICGSFSFKNVNNWTRINHLYTNIFIPVYVKAISRVDKLLEWIVIRKNLDKWRTSGLAYTNNHYIQS